LHPILCKKHWHISVNKARTDTSAANDAILAANKPSDDLLLELNKLISKIMDENVTTATDLVFVSYNQLASILLSITPAMENGNSDDKISACTTYIAALNNVKTSATDAITAIAAAISVNDMQPLHDTSDAVTLILNNIKNQYIKYDITIASVAIDKLTQAESDMNTANMAATNNPTPTTIAGASNARIAFDAAKTYAITATANAQDAINATSDINDTTTLNGLLAQVQLLIDSIPA
jgi:hypothetical protein